MTPNSLAQQLREFDILSKSIRIGLNTAKGYLKEQFNDAFTRYLTTPPQIPLHQTSQRHKPRSTKKIAKI